MPRYWHLICVKFLFLQIRVNRKTFLNWSLRSNMFYSLELQMAGVILFTAMAVGGISLWIKRRKLKNESVESSETDVSENI